MFLRDSRSPLSPETRNHFLPAARIAMLLLGAFLTMSQANTAFATPGCTIVGACNYDPDATSNDGSCDFTSCLVFGCTNPSACNFDPEADYSDGSCEYVSCAGCMNEAACDYDPDATLAATCTDFSSCYGCTTPLPPTSIPAPPSTTARARLSVAPSWGHATLTPTPTRTMGRVTSFLACPAAA